MDINMSDLGFRGIVTLLNTIQRVKKNKEVSNFNDLFTNSARLIISPNNICKGGCQHCIADSKKNGEVMNFENFVEIDPKFFEPFSIVDFGRKGDPINYYSQGKDIADFISFLYEQGIEEYTMAVAIQNREIQAAEKLEKLSQEGIKIETMFTYHHYFENLGRLTRDLNLSIREVLPFSNRIIISLLGDDFPINGKTKSEEMKVGFNQYLEFILSNMSYKQIDENNYNVSVLGREVNIHVTSKVDKMVYPIGRFRKYLEERKILQKYERFFLRN